MSFFNRMLASIGIGSTKVDTRLSTDRLVVGEVVKGTVYVQGGNVDQKIDSIYLHLMTQYLRAVNDSKVTEKAVIAKFRVADSFTVKPNERKEIPFSFTLPYETPVSIGRYPIWLRTGLDIESAVDPTDDDYIEVLPHTSMQTVLEAAESIGFYLRKTSCEYNRRLNRGLPFVQEFEFYPSGGNYRGRVDEIEFVFQVDARGIEVLIEVDRKARGLAGLFAEAMDMDERRQRVYFTHADLAQGCGAIANKLTELINGHTL